MDARKKAWAVEFINSIREMDPQVLNALIVREAGGNRLAARAAGFAAAAMACGLLGLWAAWP